jgi:MoxR-like ATPase
LLSAARANALLDGRAFCLPEDVQAVFVAAAAHRLTPGGTSHRSRDQLAQKLLDSTPVR